jgi:catechol 2,3-dioxygenase
MILSIGEMYMEQHMTQPTTAQSIHPDTHIGTVTLRVSDLGRSLAFYEGVLGFQQRSRTAKEAVLSAQDDVLLLRLQELTGAPPQHRWSAGLYHVAILLPTQADLGEVLLRLANAKIPIGQGEHLVSQALYVSDPDGQGLELYRDRPREMWQWVNGQVKMVTEGFDLRPLMDAAQQSGQFWEVLPAGTRIGHIHLRVGDLAQARDFYHTILGFDITANLPGALFLSAGGYHHHIGLNTWQSQGAGPAPTDTVGLQEFVVALPHRAALSEVQERLVARNVAIEEQADNSIVVADPWRNRVKLLAVAA